MDPSTLDPARYLEGINWPADKNEVAEKAEGNGAPVGMVGRIRNLGGEKFSGSEEVVSKLRR